MNLRDALQAPPAPRAWDRLLESLEQEDRDALEAVMRDSVTPTAHIIRVLKAAGHGIGTVTAYEARRSYRGGAR